MGVDLHTGSAVELECQWRVEDSVDPPLALRLDADSAWAGVGAKHGGLDQVGQNWSSS